MHEYSDDNPTANVTRTFEIVRFEVIVQIEAIQREAEADMAPKRE
jgi:hypothetical protein